MSGAGFPIFSDDLGLRSSEKLERQISGASLPMEIFNPKGKDVIVLIPDTWGKSSDTIRNEFQAARERLNLRLVGQVFRCFQTTLA